MDPGTGAATAQTAGRGRVVHDRREPPPVRFNGSASRVLTERGTPARGRRRNSERQEGRAHWSWVPAAPRRPTAAHGCATVDPDGHVRHGGHIVEPAPGTGRAANPGFQGPARTDNRDLTGRSLDSARERQRRHTDVASRLAVLIPGREAGSHGARQRPRPGATGPGVALAVDPWPGQAPNPVPARRHAHRPPLHRTPIGPAPDRWRPVRQSHEAGAGRTGERREDVRGPPSAHARACDG